METPVSLVEDLFERGEALSKTSIELMKLKGLETTTVVVTTLIWRFSVIITLSLFTLVVNMVSRFGLASCSANRISGFLLWQAFICSPV
jgi:hypothetical protein